ncbi:MAG: response regulator [Pseudomonadota bacterium]
MRVVKAFIDMSPSLKGKYQFVLPEQLSALGQAADVAFVNADDANSLALWNRAHDADSTIRPIMVTSEQTTAHPHTVIRRPLVLKRIEEALEHATAAETHSVARSASNGGSNSLHILVVDDSFSVRKYMEHKLPTLVTFNLAIEFADSGEQAIERVDNHAFDLMFLDVMMPGIDGYKACKQIKARKSVQVVMLTSKKSPFDKVRGAMSGCDDYITKPPQDEKIKEILENCMGVKIEAKKKAV